MTVLIPIEMFIFLFAAMIILIFIAVKTTGILSIFTSMLSIMLAFVNSKIPINGTLVQNIGGIDSTGTVVQATTTIEIPALSYICIFVGLFCVVVLTIQVMREIKFRESQDIIELDL